MSIDISIKNELDNQDVFNWNQFIFENTTEENIKYNIGNNPVLAKILSDIFMSKPIFVFIREDDKLVGVMQGCLKKNQFYSLPVFSTSGIFTINDDKRKDYYNEFVKIYKKYQIRDFIPFSQYNNSHKLASYLKLKDSIEAQLAFYKSKLRSQIIKSQKNDLKIIITDKSNLDVFFNIYSRNMHRKGVPVMSKSFFRTLLNDYQNGLINIFLVEYKGIVVATSLTLSYSEFFEVGWASTLHQYNHLGTNMFMYNEMINYAVANKMKVFSFGRCTENGSTYEFKKQWQGEFKNIYYNYHLQTNNKQKEYSIFRKIYTKIPYKIIHPISSKLRSKFIKYT